MLHIKLKDERLKLNLTQEEIAKKLGISSSSYALYEQDRRKPDYDTLIKIANLFDCSIDYLLGLTNDKKQTINIPEGYIAVMQHAKEKKISPERLKKIIELYKSFQED